MKWRIYHLPLHLCERGQGKLRDNGRGLQQDPAALKHQLHPTQSPRNPRQFLRQGETLKLSQLHDIKLLQNYTWKHVSWRLGNYTCLTNAAQMLATWMFPKLPNLTQWHLLYGVQVFLLFPGLCWILVICLKCSFLVAHLSILRHFQIPTASFFPHYFLRIPWALDISIGRVDFTENFELTGERKGREENARGNISFSKHLRTEYSPILFFKDLWPWPRVAQPQSCSVIFMGSFFILDSLGPC